MGSLQQDELAGLCLPRDLLVDLLEARFRGTFDLGNLCFDRRVSFLHLRLKQVPQLFDLFDLSLTLLLAVPLLLHNLSF